GAGASLFATAARCPAQARQHAKSTAERFTPPSLLALAAHQVGGGLRALDAGDLGLGVLLLALGDVVLVRLVVGRHAGQLVEILVGLVAAGRVGLVAGEGGSGEKEGDGCEGTGQFHVGTLLGNRGG